MHRKIIETVLSLTVITLCLGIEDNVGAHTMDEDSELYRFGRSLHQHIDPEDEPYSNQAWLNHPRDYFTPQLEGNGLLRDRREFYRFGRSQLPFEEKRFLRFGRSLHPDGEDSEEHGHVASTKPLYRKRRESESVSQSAELLHHSKRSAQSNDQAEREKNDETNQNYQKREASSTNTKSGDHISNDNALNEEQEAEKRFMRFGKRFMRFGRGDEDSGDYDKRFMRFGRDQEDDGDYEKRFMRFGKRFDSELDLDKRFMRFGKRFMRFGRGDEDTEHNEKRFMRFGKSVDYNEDPEKRFMRFGKSDDYNDDPEKRFMRFGKSMDYNEDPEKRFMRFGKRFMRFGKRFMRFGRQGEKNRNQLLDVYNDSDVSVDGGHTENSSS
ncbi:hypothetical protein BsWGS_08047 [Bradybaena similaris]